MKKKILIMTLAFAGYVGTTQSMGFIVIKKMSESSNKPKIMVPGQTTEHKHGKNYRFVSDNPNIASVKKIDEKTSHVTAHRPGITFITQVKNDDSTEKNDVKKRKGFEILVAEKSLPKKFNIKEDETKYFKIKLGQEHHQDNKNDDDAGNVITKNITLKDMNGDKFKVLKVTGKDDGENAAILVDKDGITSHITVEENDDEK